MIARAFPEDFERLRRRVLAFSGDLARMSKK